MSNIYESQEQKNENKKVLLKSIGAAALGAIGGTAAGYMKPVIKNTADMNKLKNRFIQQNLENTMKARKITEPEAVSHLANKFYKSKVPSAAVLKEHYKGVDMAGHKANVAKLYAHKTSLEIIPSATKGFVKGMGTGVAAYQGAHGIKKTIKKMKADKEEKQRKEAIKRQIMLQVLNDHDKRRRFEQIVRDRREQQQRPPIQDKMNNY